MANELQGKKIAFLVASEGMEQGFFEHCGYRQPD
jgi:hypothetical protein